MIVKNFELKKKNLKNTKFYLLFGNNDGLIEDIIQKEIGPNLPNIIFKYEENEIIKNSEKFEEDINKSFFENEKLVIIKRASDKIFNIVEKIIKKNVTDVYIIILSGPLDRKSKLRSLFEKGKQTICVPVYEDNMQTLINIAHEYLKEKSINMPQQLVNVVAERACGDRKNLKNELEKISNYRINNKSIDVNDILKITNLAENYSISELVDNCLSKNKKKILKILNENNFNSDDCIIILRTFLIKIKRLINLHKELSNNNQNIEATVASFRPPIFWKDKEIIKKQIVSFNFEEAKELIKKTNDLELLVKKNPNSSLNLTTDFVISHTK